LKGSAPSTCGNPSVRRSACATSQIMKHLDSSFVVSSTSDTERVKLMAVWMSNIESNAKLNSIKYEFRFWDLVNHEAKGGELPDHQSRDCPVQYKPSQFPRRQWLIMTACRHHHDCSILWCDSIKTDREPFCNYLRSFCNYLRSRRTSKRRTVGGCTAGCSSCSILINWTAVTRFAQSASEIPSKFRLSKVYQELPSACLSLVYQG
jgi:hypothetical protein